MPVVLRDSEGDYEAVYVEILDDCVALSVAVGGVTLYLSHDMARELVRELDSL